MASHTVGLIDKVEPPGVLHRLRKKRRKGRDREFRFLHGLLITAVGITTIW